MASGTSSSHINPHSAFSGLQDLLRQIPHPTCGQEECDRCNKAANQLEELQQEVVYIQKSLEKLSKFEEELGKHITKDEPFNFRELTRAVQHLKSQLPCASYYQFPTRGDYDHDLPPADNSNSSHQMISREYNNLTVQQKKCLWCFLVFPESAEIKKRVLINWWIGEGLLQQGASATKSRELVGEKLLGQLQLKHFIKQVQKKKRGSDSWSMEPSVRSFLTTKAKEDDRLFDLDQRILDGKAILLKSAGQVGSLNSMVNPVTTVFNVNKDTISESEARTLASMTGLIVLHLGRSQITQNNIQIDNLKLITGPLSKMKRLRLLSFQGISSLRELPGSICDLPNLMVLDLRACQALESLPSSRMGDLKNLRHLDMSGCHLLLQMPTGIQRLSNLEVLKGFVIGRKSRSCTLGDLRKLKKLHKLSIFVSRENFPQCQDLEHLATIKRLVKLKIVWNPAVIEDNEGPRYADHPTVLNKLEKLDLWCAPDYVAPYLLAPTRFPRVNKLYVRGSDHMNHLSYNHSGEADEDKWNVEILRLRFVPNLEMSWEELNGLFPKLSYLELQDCPRTNFSQYCDEEGVWKNQNS